MATLSQLGVFSVFVYIRKKLSEFRDILRQYPVFRRRSFPIESLESASEFVATRAAFVAQKTMFGYVKTRMGTSYPEMFRDDVMVSSLKIATLYHYSACLSDLMLYVFRTLSLKYQVPRDRCITEATTGFRKGLVGNLGPDDEIFNLEGACTSFKARIDSAQWDEPFETLEIFSHSPKSLVRWAPISDEFKKLDQDIAENSVTFAWIEIRKEFKDLVNLPSSRLQDV